MGSLKWQNQNHSSDPSASCQYLQAHQQNLTVSCIRTFDNIKNNVINQDSRRVLTPESAAACGGWQRSRGMVATVPAHSAFSAAKQIVKKRDVKK